MYGQNTAFFSSISSLTRIEYTIHNSLEKANIRTCIHSDTLSTAPDH